MMVSVREYFVRLVESELWVTTTSVPISELRIFTVPVKNWITIEDHRPWHVREYALPIAHGILCHHCALGRGMREAKMVAAMWRGKFARHVLLGCIEDHVHLTDVFINAWLVERLLDDVKAASSRIQRRWPTGEVGG